MPQLTKKEKKKAERAEFLRKGIDKVRKKVKKDLQKSISSKEFVAALAVALIDETYARIGNQNSESENGHYGITGWRKEHLTFSNGTATIKYVGKSGVNQKKIVRDKVVVKALKKLYDQVEDKEDPILKYTYQDRDSRLTSTDVNGYLEEFEITAKDIRGYHANEEMKATLQELRDKNGALPEDKAEREKVLNQEFEEALKCVAKCLGHEEATLRSHYLVHNFEKNFLEDGKPMAKFSAFPTVESRWDLATRLASRYYHNTHEK